MLLGPTLSAYPPYVVRPAGQYYGIAVLSIGRLLHAAMRDGVVPSEGVEACKLFSSVGRHVG